jgi:hypothetical protein
MYLSSIVDNENIINYLIEKLGSSNDLEKYVRNEISENLMKGYPINIELEAKLRDHLKNIFSNQNNNLSIGKKET